MIFENVLPAAVRGASREAGASLEQKSYTENMNKNKNENKSKKKNNNKKEHKNLNKISSYKIDTISEERSLQVRIGPARKQQLLEHIVQQS